MPVEWKTLTLLWPEVILGAAASSIFLAGAFTRSRAWWSGVAIVSYIVAAIALSGQGWPWAVNSVHSGPIVVDPMSLGLRWLAILIGLTFTLVASRLAEPDLASEFFGCLMLVAVGVMLTSAANELILLFLGLELISIPTYVLLFLGRRDRASGEATMKYFYLSILSSALLLYGFSFLYGLGKTTLIVGTAQFPGIREAIATLSGSPGNPLASLAPLALVLIVAGLGFKLAAAPLQFYAPDVYQGTTNLNAGLLAVAPKVAGVVGLIRLVVIAIPTVADFAWQLALVLSVVTMTIGNVCALWQRNVRRLLAYSSIAHGGYLLIGLAAATAANSANPATGTTPQGGVAAMLFYVLVYALATMGAFAALAYLGSSRRELNDVDELAGLARSQSLVAGALAVFMFSLAGLPPLAGFWGKLNLFTSAVQLAVVPESGRISLWFTVLTVVAALNAAIAAAYYLRIVAVMYFQPLKDPVAATGGPAAKLATIVSAALVVLAGLLPGRIFDVALRSESLLKGPATSVQATADVSIPLPQVAE